MPFIHIKEKLCSNENLGKITQNLTSKIQTQLTFCFLFPSSLFLFYALKLMALFLLNKDRSVVFFLIIKLV